MHALRLLHKMMAQACPQIHVVRLTALIASVEALLVGRQMSLAGLGRALLSGARVKHNIKRVDRLIGNRHLWGERTELYGAIAGLVLGQGPRPVIILDWSDMREDRSWQLLRAAVPVGGRSLTLYEEVHPLSAYDNRGVRKRFLDRLREILPPGCRPIFQGPKGTDLFETDFNSNKSVPFDSFRGNPTLAGLGRYATRKRGFRGLRVDRRKRVKPLFQRRLMLCQEFLHSPKSKLTYGNYCEILNVCLFLPQKRAGKCQDSLHGLERTSPAITRCLVWRIHPPCSRTAAPSASVGRFFVGKLYTSLWGVET